MFYEPIIVKNRLKMAEIMEVKNTQIINCEEYIDLEVLVTSYMSSVGG